MSEEKQPAETETDTEEVKSEILDVLTKERIVKTIKDEDLVLTAISWGVECKILALLGKIGKKIPSAILKGLYVEADSKAAISDLVITLLNDETVTKQMTSIAAFIANKNDEWISDNLNMEGVTDVILPFFLTKFMNTAKVLTNSLGATNLNLKDLVGAGEEMKK